jgi:hypothetical protein
MRTDKIPYELVALKGRFAAMPDAELYAAWGALHNPFRLQDRVMN